MSDELTSQNNDQQQQPEMAGPCKDKARHASTEYIQDLFDECLDSSWYVQGMTRQGTASWILQRRHCLIEPAPGFRVVGILKFLCREKTWQRLIAPLHDELLSEYYDTLQEGDQRKAAYQRLQIPCSLVYVVLGDRVIALMGHVCGRVFKGTG